MAPTHPAADYLPYITLIKSGSGSDQVLVFLPGLGNSGNLTIRPLASSMSPKGDILVLNHPLRGYDADKSIRLVLEAIRGYQAVILVPSSMGGLLVERIINGARRQRPNVDVKIIAHCALINGQDSAAPAGLVAKFTYWPITSRPVVAIGARCMRVLSKTPTSREAKTKGTPEYKRLQAHIRAMNAVKSSARRAQLRFIASATQPTRTYPDIPCVYVRVGDKITGDGMVRGRAAESWMRVFPNTRILDYPKLGHVGYCEQPKAWNLVMGDAFKLLLV